VARASASPSATTLRRKMASNSNSVTLEVDRDGFWIEKLASLRKKKSFPFGVQDSQQKDDGDEVKEPRSMSRKPALRSRGVLRELRRLHPSCQRACSEELEAAAAKCGLSFEHLGATIGTVIHGVDLKLNLDAAVISTIRRCLLERKVIFFRNQDITREQHLAFGRVFGPLEIHPFSEPLPGYPHVLQIAHNRSSIGQENNWHSDVTWRDTPSLGSILLQREGPELGGDTLFSDSHAQFEGLPDDIQKKVLGLTATHDFAGFRKAQLLAGVPQEVLDEVRQQFPLAHHPVIRTHPETGKQAIYVNNAFTEFIEGIPKEESAKLLKFLYEQASLPEYQCRFRWAKGSVAFWDNRSCQHYATSDYFPSTRVMERVTICGDKPFYKPSLQSSL